MEFGIGDRRLSDAFALPAVLLSLSLRVTGVGIWAWVSIRGVLRDLI